MAPSRTLHLHTYKVTKLIAAGIIRLQQIMIASFIGGKTIFPASDGDTTTQVGFFPKEN